MYYAYVIQSEDGQHLYKGHCQDLEKRLSQHNAGMTTSIRKFRPFKLIYSEAFEHRDQAVAREKYFKTAAGRRFLKGVLSQ